ncbi:MAG: purine-nucleoside phosphorylase [Propionibacteriaceae bacterium]|jgi:purine-nucleoside phosphorylase|nr:purine-nucleoside phosphorylase [Propionibacteriaceae bacterium]
MFPRLEVAPGEIAPAVLMPGDPRRAERMAAAVLSQPKVVAETRGLKVHTGLVDGRPLSIMASGMGMPAMAFYATALFRRHGVERIIRVGTAGGLSPGVGVGDVVVATGAHTSSDINEARIPGLHFAAVADFDLVRAAMEAARGDPKVVAGTIVSNDHFYREFMVGYAEALAAHCVLACEMEAAALYGVAAGEGKAGLAVCTVSNHLASSQPELTAAQRESTFDLALRLALAAALS